MKIRDHIQVTVQSSSSPYAKASTTSDPPSSVDISIIRVNLMPPTGNAGSIVGYDDKALPSNNSDQQTVISVLANSLSGMYSQIYRVIDFGDGNWKTVGYPMAISLNQPPGLGWGWKALQSGLAGISYDDTVPPTYAWTTQTPDRPILGVAVHGHGGIDPNGVAQGVQGPDGFSDTAMTQESLEKKGFNKDTNAVALALFTGCKIGSGSFMQFILRNKGQTGQIPAGTATTKNIRPCFGIAWTQNVSINAEADQSGWISEWVLYAAAFGGGPSYTFSLDSAYTQAEQNYFGSGGNNAVWSGTAGADLGFICGITPHMRRNVLIAALGGVAGLLIVVFWLVRQTGYGSSPVSVGTVSNQISAASNAAVTNKNILELRKLLVDDYRSTNSHDAMTSFLTHQLIAERLKTNDAFLVWATNAATSVIMRFITNGSVPVYGTAGLTANALQLYQVTTQAPVGLHAEAIYDPHPDTEGALLFIVEGGVKPTILMVKNSYRVETYQLNPDLWKRYPRHIQRMDWSIAVTPLDENQVDTLAHNAFHEMTGLDLNSFNFTTKILTEGILNPNAIHPEVTMTGNLNAKFFTPKDYVYPFATFQYGDSNFMLVPFSGEMVQTSLGHGEFVNLFASLKKTEAIFELGEKFLGQGTWEQDMLDQVNSMDTEQRGQVYRRVFGQ